MAALSSHPPGACMKWWSPVGIAIDKAEVIAECGALAAIVTQCLRAATLMADPDNLPAGIERGMRMGGNVENLPRHQFDAVTLPVAGLYPGFFQIRI